MSYIDVNTRKNREETKWKPSVFGVVRVSQKICPVFEPFVCRLKNRLTNGEFGKLAKAELCFDHIFSSSRFLRRLFLKKVA